MPCISSLSAAAAEQKTGTVDTRSISVIAAAMVCSFLPLSASHLISLMVGALLFFAVQVMTPAVDSNCAWAPKEKLDAARKISKDARPRGSRSSLPRAGSPSNNNAKVAEKFAAAAMAASPPKAEVWKPSVVPVLAPTFTAQGWEAEVEELLSQLTPTAETNEVVAKIALAVKSMVTQVLPGAEVTGFVGASLSRGNAFGVAVPEVDIVVSATPDAMVGRLNGRWQQGKSGSAETNFQKLRKSAVRACTDRLVTDGGFKFRRSAFRGEEPKVTIVSPQALQSVPMNLSVNAITPLCNAVLVAECARMDPRTHSLILLVKRWAKDRGLCHAARGHLSLYSWTVLSIFFLQVGADGLLPALEGLQTPSGLAVKCRSSDEPASTWRASAPPTLSVGALLKAFFGFYGSEFDWREEAVSVRSGGRAKPAPRFPLHIIFSEDGKTTEVGPSIEDPFDATSNLGACTTSASLQHLRKELRRAHELCSKGASLTELLQPWAPEMPEDGSEE